MRSLSKLVFVFLFVALYTGNALAKPPQQKDYLTALEADKIRDAETTNDRVMSPSSENAPATGRPRLIV